MTESTAAQPRPIDPDLLGTLDESAPLGAPGPLFRNDEHWLGAAEARRRAGIWSALAPRIETICAPDEKVIFLARAYRPITVGAYFALGWLAQRYGQVTLVLTDRRLIEVVNQPGGDRLEPCTRSFPWSGVAEVRYGMRKLTIVGRDGKKHRFMPRSSADRRILKFLAPRVAQRLLLPSTEPPLAFPVEHCPSCFAAWPKAEGPCPACGAHSRSGRLASWLSVAFPGGGLAYLGYPFLAFLDFVGEAAIFVVVAAGLAAATSRAEVIAAVGVGAVLGFLTKIESIHVGRHLAERTRAESAERRARAQRLGKIGAAATVLAILGAGAATGRLAGKAHDLDFAGAGGWTGSRSRAAWKETAGYEHPRSEWTHEEGLVVSVSRLEDVTVKDVDSFEIEVRREMMQQGKLGTFLFGGRFPSTLPGFLLAWKLPENRGALVLGYVVDPSDGGVHQLDTVVPLEDAKPASVRMSELVRNGRWIESLEPTP